jgi:tetratricopeptide (TPR) repeat protein
MMGKVLQMEPLNASFHFYLGQFLLAAKRLPEAATELKRALQLQPSAHTFGAYLSVVYTQQQRFAEAIATAEAEPNRFNRPWALAIAYTAQGDMARSQEQLDEMIRLNASIYPSSIALIYVLRGDTDKAFEWIDRAIAERDPGMASIYEQPYLVPMLRDDPRLATALHKLGLPTPDELGKRATAVPAVPVNTRQ